MNRERGDVKLGTRWVSIALARESFSQKTMSRSSRSFENFLRDHVPFSKTPHVLTTSSKDAKIGLYTNDLSGEARQTDLVHLWNPYSSSAANTLPANCARPALRIFAGASTLHSALPLRLAFQPLTGCARCCLQEAPGALKPSFLHLSHLSPSHFVAHFIRVNFSYFGVLSPHSYNTINFTNLNHHHDHHAS